MNFESNKEVSDSSTSSAYVPYVEARPPRGSSASFWQAVGSNWSSEVFFDLALTDGSFIDLEIEYVQADGAASPTSSLAISGGSAGAVRYPSLDGYGGGNIPCVGRTQM